MDHNVCTTITSGGPIRPKPDNTVTRKTVEEVIENLMIPYPTLSRFNTFPSNDGTDTRSSIEGVKCHHSQASFFICDDYLKIVSEKAGNFELSASGQGIKASFDVLFASPAGRTLIWSFSKKRYMTLFFTRLCRLWRRDVSITPLHLKERSWCTGSRTFDIIGSCNHHISLSEMDLMATFAGKQLLCQHDGKPLISMYN